MQKNKSSFLILALPLLGAVALFAQQPAPPATSSADGKVAAPAAPRSRISPHETVHTPIGKGGPRVTITYGRPYSKSSKTGEVRKVWGGLVPYGKADRLGADEATLLMTEAALDFSGTVIPAGAYTLYIVPSESGATQLAFSSRLGKWGVPVDESKDVARIPLTRQTLATQLDQLTLAVENDAATGGGVVKIAWETTQFVAPFALKK